MMTRFVVKLTNRGLTQYWSHRKRAWLDLDHATWYATRESAQKQADILPGSKVDVLHCPCH